MTGFGAKTYQVQSVATIDVLNNGLTTKILHLGGETVLAETESIARVTGKTRQRVHDWASRNGVQVFKCFYQGKKLFGVDVNAFIRFMSDESMIDNPYAQQTLTKSVVTGLNKALEQAIADGRDYIVIPGSTDHLRFYVKDGQPYLYMDDWAKFLGISPEEMESALKSEEFKAHMRNRWD